MRWLVITVLLVNATAWWWFGAQRELRLATPEPRTPESHSTMPLLLLLSEAPAEPEPEPEPEAEPEAEPEVEIEPVPEPEATKASAVADQPALEPAALEAAVAPEHLDQECWLIGGTAQQDALLHWRAALRTADFDIGTGIVSTQTQEVSAYRLLIPVRGDTRELMAALARHGIESYQDVASAEPAVSVGMFRVRENAMRQRRQLQQLGHDVRVVSVMRAQALYWVELRGAPGLRGRAEAVLSRRVRDAAPNWQPCAVGQPE